MQIVVTWCAARRGEAAMTSRCRLLCSCHRHKETIHHGSLLMVSLSNPWWHAQTAAVLSPWNRASMSLLIKWKGLLSGDRQGPIAGVAVHRVAIRTGLVVLHCPTTGQPSLVDSPLCIVERLHSKSLGGIVHSLWHDMDSQRVRWSAEEATIGRTGRGLARSMYPNSDNGP